MSGPPRTVHLVVHTHWDRERYLSATTTRARAAAVLTRVCALLCDGRLPGFLFDGQTVAFNELLAQAEAPLATALQRHARSGALALGPWYVMADEFLVSGESLLRNLAYGRADAAHWGQTEHTGYLPDSFGHVAQMPEILRQFGISSAVLWRGADAVANTFNWCAPSGAVAGTVFLSEGYYLHPLNQPEAPAPTMAHVSELPALLARMAAHTPAGPLLLTHGGDHLAPPAALAQRVAAFNAQQAEWRLQFATLPDHVAAALAAQPQRQHITGELRSNRSAFVLPDVLSTRRYLKRAHQWAEDRLLGETEPLLAALWPAGEALPERALERCWRTLIEQQAHDSQCGCSIDAVHEEMAQRFVQLDQALDALRAEVLQAAGSTTAWCHEGGHESGDGGGDRGGDAGPNQSRHAGSHEGRSVWADDRRFTLFNPLPQARDGWWPLTLFVHDNLAGPLQVVDETGQPLPCELVHERPDAELVSPLDDFPQQLTGRRLRLWLRAAVPGLAWRRLALQPAAAALHPRRPVTVIENAAWQVALDNSGQLLLCDRLQGWCGKLSVFSELDAGDSYNFSPPALAQAVQAEQAVQAAQAVHSTHWSPGAGWRGEHVQTLELSVTLNTPAGLAADRKGPAVERVLNRGLLRLVLAGDSPHLHATLHWHNQARDQRTRLLFSLPEGVHRTGADSAFAWIERPVVLAQVPDLPTRQEMPPAVWPSLGAITVGPWTLAHRALHEAEVVALDGGHCLGLTVVRSVGWLSRRDLRSRGLGAGPDLATPGAQCLGSTRDKFVLVAQATHEPPRDAALHAAAALRRPLLALRGHVPARPQPLDLGDARLQVSAVRRVQGRLELRLWNPTDMPLPLVLKPAHWQAVYADGRPLDAWPNPVPPHGLVTLRAQP